MGRLIAGASDAYTYLPDSTENFLPAETLAERMREAGFKNVGYQKVMFETMAIHWGTK
jgi:demethylmenaquinone methyltransferase/2-methoxy-6-polyprenyl-1,4-benzoquinol methylase